MKVDWPRGPTTWIEGRVRHVSVPFTWNMPAVRADCLQTGFAWDRTVVGGPAVALLPGYLDGLHNVTTGDSAPGALQRINPLATRTTTGCVRRCGFCAIGTGVIEGGGFRELDDWPDLPILCDNNLMAASMPHIERVVERLERWGWADFNQGLDARLLTPTKARLLARIKKPLIRLALDNMAYVDSWLRAYDRLREAGISKAAIRSHCLVAFDSGPDEAWPCNSAGAAWDVS